MNENFAYLSENMYRIVLGARARSRIHYHHIVLFEGFQNACLYRFVIIRNNIIPVRDAALLTHHCLEHPGVRLNNVSLLWVLIWFHDLCPGRNYAYLRLCKHGYLSDTAGKQHSYVYRTYPVASGEYHLALNYILSYRPYMLPCRSCSAYNHAAFSLLGVLCHYDSIIWLSYRVSGIYDDIVLSCFQCHRRCL